MTERSRRSSGVAPCNHANQETGTEISRPSSSATRSRSSSTTAEAARGRRSGALIEEVIPSSQEQVTVCEDDPSDPAKFARIVPLLVTVSDRQRPIVEWDEGRLVDLARIDVAARERFVETWR